MARDLMMNDYQNFKLNGNFLDNPFGVDDLAFRYSTIPLLITIYIIQSFNTDSAISVKKLFSAFQCSSLTVKKYLDQLISLELVQIVQSSSDRRVRYLKPTSKLLDLMDTYTSGHLEENNVELPSRG